jgi:hypothetical protein
MGSIFGGPKVTQTPAPAPLFPGVSNTFVNALQSSGITGTSFGTLNQAAATGLPTDVGPAFEALKASMARGTDEARTNLKEKYGFSGLSGGSDLEKGAVDFEAQNQANLNNILANYTMQASEAAANRQVGAATAGLDLVSAPAEAFRQTGVVSNQPGILGGIGSLMNAFFPNFDLGQFGGGLGAVLSGGV